MKKLFVLLSMVCFLTSCDSRSGGNSGVGSYNPSFTGSGDSNSGAFVLRTVTAFYSNGVSAGRYEIVQRGSYQYARIEGGTQEYSINEDYQNGFNYVFWNGAAWLFFY